MRDSRPIPYPSVFLVYLSLLHFETKRAVKNSIFFVDFINIVTQWYLKSENTISMMCCYKFQKVSKFGFYFSLWVCSSNLGSLSLNCPWSSNQTSFTALLNATISTLNSFVHLVKKWATLIWQHCGKNTNVKMIQSMPSLSEAPRLLYIFLPSRKKKKLASALPSFSFI